MSRPNKTLPSLPPSAAAPTSPRGAASTSPSSPRGAAPMPPSRAAPTPAPRTLPVAPTAVSLPPVAKSPRTPLPDKSPRVAGVASASPSSGKSSPRKFPDKPPPLPPRAPPTNLAVGAGRNIRSPDKRRSVMLQKKVMPTLRPVRGPQSSPSPPPVASEQQTPNITVTPTASPIKKVMPSPSTPPPTISLGVVCSSCGAATTEAFCGECGNRVQDTSFTGADGSFSLDGLLEDAKLKVCIDCTEEGFDAFCAKCGGKMVALEDDADDSEELDLPPATPTNSSVSLSISNANDAMARLEAALLEGSASSSAKSKPDLQQKPSTPSSSAAVKTPASAAAPVTPAARPAASTPATAAKATPVTPATPLPLAAGPLFSLPKVPKERVFVVDLGSDSVKYGWNTDAEASRIRACVDGRANVNTGGYTVKGQVYPMDSTVSDMDDKLFTENNIYLDDLAQKICKVGNYNHDSNALLVCSSVPNHFECVSDWIYRLGEGEVTGKKPRMFFVGYTPLFALMAAQNSPSPTGLVVDVGAIGTSVVPIYAGCKLDHAIQTQMMGGRLVAEIVGSNSQVTARDENAVANAVKSACFVARDFKQEMAANGMAPAAVAMGQTWRGWKSSGGAEKFVEVGPVRVGVARFCVPELFFNPSFHAQTAHMAALPAMIQAAIVYCPKPMQPLLLQNVYIHGEGARFPGMAERLQGELSALFHGASVRVTQCAPNAGWEGAKRFSCMDAFPAYCTNAQDMARYSKLSHRFF